MWKNNEHNLIEKHEYRTEMVGELKVWRDGPRGHRAMEKRVTVDKTEINWKIYEFS